jgi:hypothetical protein
VTPLTLSVSRLTHWQQAPFFNDLAMNVTTSQFSNTEIKLEVTKNRSSERNALKGNELLLSSNIQTEQINWQRSQQNSRCKKFVIDITKTSVTTQL